MLLCLFFDNVSKCIISKKRFIDIYILSKDNNFLFIFICYVYCKPYSIHCDFDSKHIIIICSYMSKYMCMCVCICVFPWLYMWVFLYIPYYMCVFYICLAPYICVCICIFPLLYVCVFYISAWLHVCMYLSSFLHVLMHVYVACVGCMCGMHVYIVCVRSWCDRSPVTASLLSPLI